MTKTVSPKVSYFPKVFILIVVFFISYFWIGGKVALAVSCSSVAAGGAYTVSASCTFPNTVDGVDNGNLAVALGQTLTINAGQTVAWNSGNTVTVTGSIAINSTGQLKQTNLWMVDTDGDGFADSLTQSAQNTAPTFGRRRNVMASTTAADTSPTDSTKWQNLTGYTDADSDTFTTGAAQQVSSGASLPSGYKSVATATDCNDANATVWQNITGYADADVDTFTTGGAVQVCSGASLPSGYRAAATATDCNDANGAVWRNRYRDVDADAFGAGVLVCVGNDAGYVDNGTDCNDANATVWQNLTGYSDADNDTFTSGAAQSICSGASLPGGYRSAANGADCNDGDATKWQNLTGYTDSDADGYGSASSSVCSGASLPAPYIATSGDCYDSNSLARPGQTTYWFTTNRGDGSFDYDCNGTANVYTWAWRTKGIQGATTSCVTDPYTGVQTCTCNLSPTILVEAPASSYCGTNPANPAATNSAGSGIYNNCSNTITQATGSWPSNFITYDPNAIYYTNDPWNYAICGVCAAAISSDCQGRGSQIGGGCILGSSLAPGVAAAAIYNYTPPGSHPSELPLPCR